MASVLDMSPFRLRPILPRPLSLFLSLPLLLSVELVS